MNSKTFALTTTSATPATGIAVFTKPAKDTLTQIFGSGTYGGVQFPVEGTSGAVDGSGNTLWFPVLAFLKGSGGAAVGTISPADNAKFLYEVQSAGLTQLRIALSAISSGELDLLMQSGAYSGIPPLGSVLSGGTLSGVTLSGTTTVTGDVIGQEQVASANGAVTIKSGVVYVTKAGVAALTISDPVATTDDGKSVTIISTTANAHTLSNAAGSGFNGGGAGTDVGTFGGAKGDGMRITAYQGVWYVEYLRNVTLG